MSKQLLPRERVSVRIGASRQEFAVEATEEESGYTATLEGRRGYLRSVGRSERR